MIALAQLIALVASAIALATSAALFRRSVVDRTARLPPREQVLALEAIVLAPWALPILVVALALAPSALAWRWPSFDHCGSHDHHAHLCLAHPPEHASAIAAVLVALAALWAFARAGAAIERELQAHRDVRELLAAARREGELWSLPSSRVICAVAGALAPGVVLSEGARARVAPSTLEIALAHERAHVARHDVVRQSLARVLASIQPSPEWMLEALAIARERACDERAALEHDRVDVAEALVRFARAADQDLPPAMLGFGPEVLEARVRALLEEPIATPSRAITLALAATLGALALGAPFVHHALETLLGALAH